MCVLQTQVQLSFAIVHLVRCCNKLFSPLSDQIKLAREFTLLVQDLFERWEKEVFMQGANSIAC